MLWTNVDHLGGNFLNQLDQEFSLAKNITIASGYVSLDILNMFKPIFEKKAYEGGEVRLLIGMALYEGLSASSLSLLKDLGKKLESYGNNCGVYISYNGRFHGKLYIFDTNGKKKIYLGSSNFSRSGLAGNIECTASISDIETQQNILDFVQYLFNGDNATSILHADIIVPGSMEYKKRIAAETLSDLKKYNPKIIDKSIYTEFDFSLSHIADKEKSNLNVYFGKGRLTTSTGKVTPRPWYEVELIANKDVRSSPIYPKGDFIAYTDDGFVIPMYTGGDFYKNIRSRGNLQILGQWIKNKLQQKNALIPLTPVTRDTLDLYGNDTIRFYKMEEGKYYMEF